MMKEFNSVNDILDFAMGQEQGAVDFYTQIAGYARNAEMKKIFLDFAQEEVGHKARLQKIKEEQIFVISAEKIADLKISDYTDNVVASPDMKYDEALILAMKREKAAFRLYSNLAASTGDANMKNLFLSLAQEESKHKLRFELEYDDYVLREN
jgi:rubrerythrin